MADNNYIFGFHAIQTALEHDPSKVPELWVDAQRRDKRMSIVLDLAKDAGTVVHNSNRHELEQLVAGARHQGIVARSLACEVYDERDLAALLANIDEPPLLLVLDGVQDPHNLGACLRSADAAGVHAVVVPKDRAASLTATVIKVACGAAQTVPFFQVTNLARTLRDLKEQGVWTVGLDGYAEQSLYDTDLKGPLAILMGAEGQGLRRLTKEHCDFLVMIPMAGSVESLNVSVATGVCLFEALRQRSL